MGRSGTAVAQERRARQVEESVGNLFNLQVEVTERPIVGEAGPNGEWMGPAAGALGGQVHDAVPLPTLGAGVSGPDEPEAPKLPPAFSSPGLNQPNRPGRLSYSAPVTMPPARPSRGRARPTRPSSPRSAGTRRVPAGRARSSSSATETRASVSQNPPRGPRLPCWPPGLHATPHEFQSPVRPVSAGMRLPNPWEVLRREARRPRLPSRQAPSRQTRRRRGAGSPLPDAQAVRTRFVPDAAPPYDDATTPAAAGQGEAPAVRAAKVAVVLQGEDGADEQAGIARQAGRAQPAVPGRWPSKFAQVLAEALAGSRPSKQLTPWTTEQARKRINELGPMLSGARQPKVRRVIVSSPAQGVLEMTVIVDYGARARAVAVRLEQPSRPSPAAGVAGEPDVNAYRRRRASTTGWVCTAIEAA